MPYYIIIIDDYSSVCNFDEIDNLVESITRMGWNVGIYVILTTNHPSAKVIPTVSKSNFPARLSFRVASCKASQIIIDKNGAESLKLGEALYKSRYTDSILKLDVPYISDDDINSIINWCMKEQAVFYQIEEVDNYEKSVKEEYDDPIYNEVLEFVIQFDKVSSSLIQRKFRIGYNRAARILDLLEERGIVGPNEGNSLREVLIRLNNKT